ncbi:hypothetical protein AB0Y14_11875 [Rothia sp. HC945]|uniref:hypothetical protein n=1 Tax=Rothia sp. HC945 TaxID=3171170 RepID=UPI003F1F2185
MLEGIQTLLAETSLSLRVVIIFAISAIPFVESYFGSALGVLGGLHPAVAVAVASLGNFVSMVLLVYGGQQFHLWRTKGRNPEDRSRSVARFYRLFDKYGVPGVSLLGQTVLPSQITSGLMATLGADKNKIIAWQGLSIILWGALFAGLAAAGVAVVN